MNLPTKELLNKHAIISVTDPRSGTIPEQHTGRVTRITYSGDKTWITFDSGVFYLLSDDKIEEHVTVLGYKWPRGLFRGTVAFPHYKHRGLFACVGDQLFCFTYSDTRPKIVPGESIHILDVALLDVEEENIGNPVISADDTLGNSTRFFLNLSYANII